MSFLLGKKKLKIDLPSGWHEVPFNIGLKIVSQGISDKLTLMSLLSGLPKNKITETTDLETVYLMMSTLFFLNEQPFKKLPEFPRSIPQFKLVLPWVSYGDKFDLGGCQVGQIEDMKVYISQNLTDDNISVLEISLALVSIYLDPLINEDKIYNYNRAVSDKALSKLGNELDYKVVTNMGAFFFEKLNVLVSGSKKDANKLVIMRRKLMRGLKNLVQRLVSILP